MDDFPGWLKREPHRPAVFRLHEVDIQTEATCGLLASCNESATE